MIDQYFDHPKLTKVGNNNGNSIYMAKNTSHLVTTHRYIIVMVPTDVVIMGQTIPLSDLHWTSFQTRTFSVKEHNPEIYSYMPKKTAPFTSLIVQEEDTSKYSSYRSQQFPLKIYIFKKETSDSFPSRAQLNSALETYSTLIQFV